LSGKPSISLAPPPMPVAPEAGDGDKRPEPALPPVTACSSAPNASATPASTTAAPGRDQQMLVDTIRQGLIDGAPDLKLAEDLGLTQAEYRRLKGKMYEQAVDGLVGKTAEMQYVDYQLDQARCLAELDTMIKEFSSTKQYNAMVGAVRAKSQILGDIHKTGVQMGVIKNEASWDREVAGQRVADLSTKELRTSVAAELRGLQGFIDKFEDKPMAEVDQHPPMADANVQRVKH
jgi:hypothetical protein